MCACSTAPKVGKRAGDVSRTPFKHGHVPVALEGRME
jgi:hypothetical protein